MEKMGSHIDIKAVNWKRRIPLPSTIVYLLVCYFGLHFMFKYAPIEFRSPWHHQEDIDVHTLRFHSDIDPLVKIMKIMVQRDQIRHPLDPNVSHTIMPPMRFSDVSLGPDDVSLATHVSATKMDALLIQIKEWGGPVSVAIYAKTQEMLDDCQKVLKANVAILHKTTVVFVVEYEDIKLAYPFNVLRNVALRNVQSDFFLAMDVDFITSDNAYKDLVRLVRDNTYEIRTNLMKKTLYVLPAFQLFPKEGEEQATIDMMPHSKDEVLTMLEDDRIQPFHYKLREKEKEWQVRANRNHESTDFRRWLSVQEPTYDIERLEDKFEPYVLVYKPGVPNYNGGFRGWGLNKVSWFRELWYAGYSYKALRDFYVVHLDHPPTKVIETGPSNFEAVWDSMEQFLMNYYPPLSGERIPKEYDVSSVWKYKKKEEGSSWIDGHERNMKQAAKFAAKIAAQKLNSTKEQS